MIDMQDVAIMNIQKIPGIRNSGSANSECQEQRDYVWLDHTWRHSPFLWPRTQCIRNMLLIRARNMPIYNNK